MRGQCFLNMSHNQLVHPSYTNTRTCQLRQLAYTGSLGLSRTSLIQVLADHKSDSTLEDARDGQAGHDTCDESLNIGIRESQSVVVTAI